MQKVSGKELPKLLVGDTIYRLLPGGEYDLAFYRERTDRNIGWITKEEQEILKKSVVAIAGCGGMGGLVASAMIRLGVGEIRLADNESFDRSNLNRQFAATRETIGMCKAGETARMLRAITNDSVIEVYPQGIREETAAEFVNGADVVCDEIEFWELEAAMLLHRAARSAGVTIFGCNTCGFGTHLFKFTPESQSIEEAFGLSLEEAREIDEQRRSHTLPPGETKKLMEMLLRVVTPAITEYCPEDARANLEVVRTRLLVEGKASIVSTNPVFAAGFVADRILLHLLRNSGVKRDIVDVPSTPGYLYLDAAKMLAVTCPSS